MDQSRWYQQLVRPTWAPPAWLFGPVWTVLYILIAISFGMVAWGWWQGRVSTYVLAPFVANLIANGAFTPIQFGLKNNVLAALDVIAVLISLACALYLVWPLVPLVVYLNLPYLGWVTFATILQLTITKLNWGRQPPRA